MTLWVSKGSSKYMCIIIYYSIEKDKIFMTTYQEKLSDHYMMYVWFPSRHLKLNVHQTNFCMVWYVKFRTRRREFLHKCEFVVILKFQINDQFALIQFALAVQVIEWGQSM